MSDRKVTVIKASLYAVEVPGTTLKELGIEWVASQLNTVTESQMFYVCKNVPETLPYGLQVAQIDVIDLIGRGLTSDQAKAVLDGQA